MPPDQPLTHIGTSSLRIFTAAKLKAMNGACVIHCHSQPLAVLVPYQRYLEMQHAIEAFREKR